MGCEDYSNTGKTIRHETKYKIAFPEKMERQSHQKMTLLLHVRFPLIAARQNDIRFVRFDFFSR